MALLPFFSYFGSKWRVAGEYPEPRHESIIEPFAGSASYSLHYPFLDVTLYEANAIVAGVWDFLTRAPESDVRALPAEVEHVDELDCCQEARWLVGFWLRKATTHPAVTVGSGAWRKSRVLSHWGAKVRERIAKQQASIRHWRIFPFTYDFCPNPVATWFVDPPYQHKCGRAYPQQVRDYAELATWCRARNGQVIVCEQKGADWLPFVPFKRAKATTGFSEEVVWTQ